MHSLASAMIKYLDIKPIIVGADLETGLRIELPNPKQVGADRIVDAVAAYELYGGPVLVMDFGTATTYDIVDGTGAFIGGGMPPRPIRRSSIANTLFNCRPGEARLFTPPRSWPPGGPAPRRPWRR